MSEYPTPTEDDLEQVRALLRAKSRMAISVVEAGDPLSQDDPYPSSYFGGLPFLPDGMDWPSSATGPMTFLAQISMSDLPHVDGSPLPASGRLLFFSRTDFSGDFEPEDCAVLFDEKPAIGSPASPPDGLPPVGGGYKDRLTRIHPGVELRYRINFAPMETYPSWHSIPRNPVYKYVQVVDGRTLDISEQQAQEANEGVVLQVVADEGVSGLETAFYDVLEEFVADATNIAWPELDLTSLHQMLGYGENIQWAAQENEADVILLQLCGTPFGYWLTDGALIFWIRPEDLQQRNFARAYTSAEWS